MSEMINRVAEALCYAKPVTFEDMAKVAIAAMREPTQEMIDAGFLEACSGVYHYELTGAGFDKDSTKPVWQTMVDEALK